MSSMVKIEMSNVRPDESQENTKGHKYGVIKVPKSMMEGSQDLRRLIQVANENMQKL